MATIKNSNYETSLVLANRNSPYHVMTLKNIHKEEKNRVNSRFFDDYKKLMEEQPE